MPRIPENEPTAPETTEGALISKVTDSNGVLHSINATKFGGHTYADVADSIQAVRDSIPTSTSQLTNDSGFITNAVSDLQNYYQKQTTYTKDEVNALVSAIPKFSIEVVDELPEEDISTTTIYLLRNSEQGSSDLYDEYIYVDDAWEKLGSQTLNLEDYVKKANDDEEVSITDYFTHPFEGIVSTEDCIVLNEEGTFVESYYELDSDGEQSRQETGIASTSDGVSLSSNRETLEEGTGRYLVKTANFGSSLDTVEINTESYFYGDSEEQYEKVGDGQFLWNGKRVIAEIGTAPDNRSTSLGVDSTAGIWAFRYKGYTVVEEGSFNITLVGDSTSNVDAIEVGDIFSMKADYSASVRFSVASIISKSTANQEITLKITGDASVMAASNWRPVQCAIDSTDPDWGGTGYAWFPKKPDIGIAGTVNEVTGAGAFSMGYQSHANEVGAFATGMNAVADGKYSFASGRDTLAGYASHAEGYLTQATDLYSHAEGRGSVASGQYSHAQNGHTIASGKYSSASGYQSEARGSGSTASGYQTIASGVYATSSNYLTNAVGAYSTAAGARTTALGNGSHIEGGSLTVADWSAATQYKVTNGTVVAYSGSYYICIKDSIGIEPTDEEYWRLCNIADGVASHVEGTANTNAKFNTSRSGQAGHVEGYANYNDGARGHVEGFQNSNKFSDAHVQGRYAVDNTSYADVIGWGTSAARKNISSLTTAGNLHLAGDVFVLSDADGKNGVKLATVADLKSLPFASTGSTLDLTTDLNDVVTPGNYLISSKHTAVDNFPSTKFINNATQLVVFKAQTATFIFQYAMCAQDVIYIRRKITTGWQAWHKILTDSDLQTVANIYSRDEFPEADSVSIGSIFVSNTDGNSYICQPVKELKQFTGIQGKNIPFATGEPLRISLPSNVQLKDGLKLKVDCPLHISIEGYSQDVGYLEWRGVANGISPDQYYIIRKESDTSYKVEFGTVSVDGYKFNLILNFTGVSESSQNVYVEFSCSNADYNPDYLYGFGSFQATSTNIVSIEQKTATSTKHEWSPITSNRGAMSGTALPKNGDYKIGDIFVNTSNQEAYIMVGMQQGSTGAALSYDNVYQEFGDWNEQRLDVMPGSFYEGARYSISQADIDGTFAFSINDYDSEDTYEEYSERHLSFPNLTAVIQHLWGSVWRIYFDGEDDCAWIYGYPLDSHGDALDQHGDLSSVTSFQITSISAYYRGIEEEYWGCNECRLSYGTFKFAAGVTGSSEPSILWKQITGGSIDTSNLVTKQELQDAIYGEMEATV